MKLILASASPRRAHLLDQAGYRFDIEPADIDESTVPFTSPSEYAQRLAVLKAETIATSCPDDVILAADTIVALGERVLGKPTDANHAREMLQLLSGTTQIVITGVCVMRKSAGFQLTTRVMSSVKMDALKPEQIEAYIATGEWEGKAGGYGIQDNDPFVKRVSGSHTNVVGLPMETVTKMLTRANILSKDQQASARPVRPETPM